MCSQYPDTLFSCIPPYHPCYVMTVPGTMVLISNLKQMSHLDCLKDANETVNLFRPNGISHPYQFDESNRYVIRGLGSICNTGNILIIFPEILTHL